MALLFWIAFGEGLRYVQAALRKPPKKKKKLEYPEETNATRWAAEARKLASKMTAAERAEHFRQAMVKIYGGELKKAVGSRP